MLTRSCALLLMIVALPAGAAEDTANGGNAQVTIQLDMVMTDSLTLTVTGDATGNTTLGIPDTSLDFGNVYFGAIGPLGTAGLAYQNVLESNEYVISRLQIDVLASGLLTGADISASEGAGALYSDATNITAVVTNVGNVLTPWAIDGITGVNDLTTNPALGSVLNLVPQSLEAGFRVDSAASSGATSVPFVITAAPI